MPSAEQGAGFRSTQLHALGIPHDEVVSEAGVPHAHRDDGGALQYQVLALAARALAVRRPARVGGRVVEERWNEMLD